MRAPTADGLNEHEIEAEIEAKIEAKIEATMLRLITARGPDKTVCPSEVARALGGPDAMVWRRLMQPVRRVAVRLAGQGRVAILRKGKPVADPDDFRGIYRLGMTRDDRG